MQNDNRKKEYYKKMFDKSRSWPTCFEKCLITSLYFLISADSSKKNDETFSNECDVMMKRLNIEGLVTEEYKKTIECLKVVLENQNWPCAQKELEKMFKELRILDISKIEELREEINKAHAELKGKDVILFLNSRKLIVCRGRLSQRENVCFVKSSAKRPAFELKRSFLQEVCLHSFVTWIL